VKPAIFPAGTLSRGEDGAISEYEASRSSRQPGDENGYDVSSMTDRYTRTPGSSITPLLAGAALVLAGYLVLDRIGMFDSAPDIETRVVTPRGDLADSEKTTIEIFERNSPSAVHITSTHRQRRRVVSQGTGSGIIWDTQGYILTNYHVVTPRGDTNHEILVRLHDKTTLTAKYVFGYAYVDMAIIRLDKPPRGLKPAVIGTSGDLKVGQNVFAIGNPFGLEQTLTSGIISALNRSIKTKGDVELDGVIQVDAAINPGNSGGLLLDSAGMLIGMNTAIYSQKGESAGIGFAVPIDRIAPMVPRMMAKKPPIDAGLGIKAHNLRQPLGREVGYGYGVVITEVTPGGGADEAGLRAMNRVTGVGDVIVRAEGKRIETLNGLYRILEKHKGGDTITITLARFDGTDGYHVVPTKVTLKLLENPRR
jgi:S1-C subfamily serine protease